MTKCPECESEGIVEAKFRYCAGEEYLASGHCVNCSFRVDAEYLTQCLDELETRHVAIDAELLHKLLHDSEEVPFHRVQMILSGKMQSQIAAELITLAKFIIEEYRIEEYRPDNNDRVEIFGDLAYLYGHLMYGARSPEELIDSFNQKWRFDWLAEKWEGEISYCGDLYDYELGKALASVGFYEEAHTRLSGFVFLEPFCEDTDEWYELYLYQGEVAFELYKKTDNKDYLEKAYKALEGAGAYAIFVEGRWPSKGRAYKLMLRISRLKLKIAFRMGNIELIKGEIARFESFTGQKIMDGELEKELETVEKSCVREILKSVDEKFSRIKMDILPDEDKDPIKRIGVIINEHQELLNEYSDNDVEKAYKICECNYLALSLRAIQENVMKKMLGKPFNYCLQGNDRKLANEKMPENLARMDNEIYGQLSGFVHSSPGRRRYKPWNTLEICLRHIIMLLEFVKDMSSKTKKRN